jgi:hypothetical protein
MSILRLAMRRRNRLLRRKLRARKPKRKDVRRGVRGSRRYVRYDSRLLRGQHVHWRSRNMSARIERLQAPRRHLHVGYGVLLAPMLGGSLR